MYYEFYYKIKDHREHIICYIYDTEGNIKSRIIGNTKNLIEFIKHNCLNLSEVRFIDFDSSNIKNILNELNDTIEIIYPPFGDEGPYQMSKRRARVRGW